MEFDPNLPLIFTGIVLVLVFIWGVYDWWRYNMRPIIVPHVMCACEKG